MSAENVSLVKRVYDAFEQRNLAWVLDMVDPKIEVWQSETLPWGGTYRGIAQFREYATALTQHVDARVKVTEILDAGDRTVALGRSKGRAWKSEARFDVPVVHVWTVRKGSIARLEVHMDTAAMLQAINGR